MGRMLALGILIVLLLLVWEAGARPLIDWYGARADALAGERARFLRMEALVASLPALRKAVAAGEGSAPTALLDGASDAVAGASLQESVQRMAASLGANLASTEALPARQEGSYRRIGVRIALNARYDILVRLVAAIEQAAPSMLIDDLQMHGSRILLSTAQPLEASMTVIAYRKGTAPGGAGAAADAGTQDDGREGAP